MKIKHTILAGLVLLALLTLNTQLSTAFAQGTAFTYQGRLIDGGSPATGVYDLRFTICDALTSGNVVAGPNTNSATGVTNGLFAVTLDFGGGVFTGSNRWVEIAARTNGAASFITLAPRQPISPVPYSIMANSASNLLGTLPTAQLTGVFTGNGSGLTSLNPAGLSAGTAGINISGNAATVTHGVYDNGSYADPGWITSLAGGKISGNIGGNAATATTANNFSGSLAGDVTGTQSATVVASVSGQSAANVASGASAANAATSANTANTIVKRDASGNFSAGTITANLAGSAALASNVVSGISITNAFITNSVFAGNGGGLTNLNASQLASGTIPLAQLPAVAVTNGATGVALSGSFTGNGTGLTNVNAAALNGLNATNFWQTAGNAGTSPANGNFLGTLDNQPLELRVNGSRALRLEPTASDFAHAGFVNVVGGSPVNYIAPGVYGSVIAGGGAANYYGSAYTNSVAADVSFLGGGGGNSIQAIYAFLGGGQQNSILQGAHYSFLGGGNYNSIQTNAQYDFLGGGDYNSIQPYADFAFLGGGVNNSIQPNAYCSFLGGGSYNTNGGDFSAVPGGDQNYAGGKNSFAAGHRAKALHTGSFVWGDSTDADVASTGPDQFIVRANGGFFVYGTDTTAPLFKVVATANYGSLAGLVNVVGGSPVNYIAPGVYGSVIAGGGLIDFLSEQRIWVNEPNSVSANLSFLGGGFNNSIQTNAYGSFLGGGGNNSIQTNALYAFLGGGSYNTNGGNFSAVPGGDQNYAGGKNSFAAGHRAKANNQGDFVLADSQDADFPSTTANELSGRFSGGVRWVTGGAGMTIDGQPVLAGSLSSTYVDLSSSQSIGGTKTFSGSVGIGISPSFLLDVNGRMALRGSSSGTSAGLWLYDSAAASHTSRSFLGLDGMGYVGLWGDMGANWGMVMNVTNGYVGIGTETPDALLTVNGAADKPGGGSWTTFSDGRLKDVGAKFTHGLADLERIQPVHYHYKADNQLNLPSQPEYVGVVAQQVQPAIPEAVQSNKDGYLTVNNDPIIWTMVNAIKELNRKIEDKNAENAELKARLEKLEQLLEARNGGGQ